MVRDSSFDRQEGTTLRTPWADAIDPDNVLAEYPRPQMRRDSYLNLNGYWSYSINESETCSSYEGKILVPFSPESVLSGVQRSVRPGEYLHYHRKITLPHGFMKDRLVIHFGAVDQTATLFINDREVGTHTGGFTAFRFDITDFLTGDEIDIRLTVTDISDTGCHQTGKQRIERGGIWYTPQSGIWQTVWMESLPSTHIRDLRLTPLYPEQAVRIEIERAGTGVVSVEARLNGIVQATALIDGDAIVLPLKELHAWTPETPHLYDLTVQLGDDVIQSYFGMRHFEMREDAKGRNQFYLNGRPYFQNGVLDQGYYPDGLLTPPGDEAMIYDIELMKSMGFNMLRKHIKIEPLRWYYHCDRLGMLVWQDMVSGSERKDILFHGILAIAGIHLKDHRYRLFGRKNADGRRQFELELVEMLAHLKNTVCINTWVPFNEAWGQFDARRIADAVASIDNTRLIDHASGWSDQDIGHYHSRHIYFTKIRFARKDARRRILALTEFGGYSLPVDGHLFDAKKIFGYKVFRSQADYQKAVTDLYHRQVLPQIEKGLSALVYTQVSDVEDEVNGFVTYDRRIVKMDVETMRSINDVLLREFKRTQDLSAPALSPLPVL